MCVSRRALKAELERIYAAYHRRQYVDPDPLLFLYDYEDLGDREIVGLLASALAYGRVAQIMVSVADLLRRLGPSPAGYLDETSPSRLRRDMAGFVHRFADAEAMASLLGAIRRVRRAHGGLCASFCDGFDPNADTILPALTRFVECLQRYGAGGHLMPHPGRGSACKRLHLFLRWMVRKDEVDPGGWDAVPATMLLVPLDVHMHRVGSTLGFTRRRSADAVAAQEVTAGFRNIAPDDPVKYDFSITRLGIRSDGDMGAFLKRVRD